MKPEYALYFLTVLIACLYAGTRDSTLGVLTNLCVGATIGLTLGKISKGSA